MLLVQERLYSRLRLGARFSMTLYSVFVQTRFLTRHMSTNRLHQHPSTPGAYISGVFIMKRNSFTAACDSGLRLSMPS